ncbi:1700_t:CDS:2, partial [Cetraspora pellucida]
VNLLTNNRSFSSKLCSGWFDYYIRENAYGTLIRFKKCDLADMATHGAVTGAG